MASEKRTKRTGRDPLRMAEVERRIIALQPNTKIAKEVAAAFEVSFQTVYLDIAKIWDKLVEHDKLKIDRRRAQMWMALTARYRRAIARGDNRGEDFAIDRLCRIDGLYVPDIVSPPGGDVPTNEDRIARLTTTQRRDQIANLLTMMDERAEHEAKTAKSTKPKKG